MRSYAQAIRDDDNDPTRNLDLERSIVGLALKDYPGFLAKGVNPEWFTSPECQQILDYAANIHEAGERTVSIDTIVAEHQRVRGPGAHVASFSARLYDHYTLPSMPADVDLLRDNYRAYSLRQGAMRVVSLAECGEMNRAIEQLDETAASMQACNDTKPSTHAYHLLSDSIARTLKPVGQRLSTGLASLDEATRGGLPLGRLVMVLGAPGGGKTTLVTWWLDSFERQGCACCYIAADEPSEGIITRLGQLDGWSRDALESEGDAGDAVRAGFAKRAQGRPLTVIDPDANERLSTIEDAEAALLHLAGDRLRVLIVDSLQTVRCKAAEGFESERERINAKIAVLKAIAKRGTLVIVISEMARGAYRSGDRTQDTSALAAGKESGAIEYGAALLLGLRSVKSEHGQVDVEVAKNRLGGSKPEFRVQIDFDRASFAEIASPTPGERAHRKDAETKHRIIEAVLRNPGLTSATRICEAAKGTKSDNLAMIKSLTEAGVLARSNGAFIVAQTHQPGGTT